MSDIPRVGRPPENLPPKDRINLELPAVVFDLIRQEAFNRRISNNKMGLILLAESPTLKRLLKEQGIDAEQVLRPRIPKKYQQRQNAQNT